MKVLFLDLDGTIRETKSGAKFISDPLDQQPIEGATQKVREYSENGWTIIGITNQMGVLKGYKTLENMVAEQQETLKLFPEIRRIHACPNNGESIVCIWQGGLAEHHTCSAYGNFRKPETGMINFFMSGRKDLITQALMVGDMASDELCALKANIPFMWASDWLKSPV